MRKDQALGWQRSWDRQQEVFMPDREERFSALLDVVEANCGPKPRVLDLACGTAAISRRLLERLPDATSVGVDFDPVMLRIASGTFSDDPRVRLIKADLSTPGWQADVGDEPFDAVLTATALHWLPAPRLSELYAEVRELLADGGVFCNADHMTDPDLPGLTERIEEFRRTQRNGVLERGEALSWDDWWAAARNAPELADAIAERDRLLGRSAHGDSLPLVDGHLSALRAAGYTEVGLVWRGLTDAAFAALG